MTPTTSARPLPWGPQSTYAGRRLGSAELVVRGTEGQVFAVPNLIIHYIDAHDYLPPPAFVDACLAGPGPFGLTVAQIAEGAVNQPERTWEAVHDGALETSVLGDRVALSLYGMMLDTLRRVPDVLTPEVRPLRAGWRDREGPDVRIDPWGVREVLRWWFDRMGPDEKQATLQAWLDGTRSWSATSTVLPIAACLPYNNPISWLTRPVTRLIGYWRAELSVETWPMGPEQAQEYEWLRQQYLGWPDPAAFIDAAWDGDVRRAVLHHLETGTLVNQYRGHSQCRFCGRDNGSAEMTDGTYCWPEGLAHYVRKHAVRLPEEYVDHVTARPSSGRPMPWPEFDRGGNRDRDWPGVSLRHRLWPYRPGGASLEQSGDGPQWRVDGRVVRVHEIGDNHQLYIDVDSSWWRSQATPATHSGSTPGPPVQSGRTSALHGSGVHDWARDPGTLTSWVDQLLRGNQGLRGGLATDGLTELPNPRALALAEQLLAPAEYSIGVLFIDLDHFHDYNCRYGYRAGDECLKDVASALAGSLRAGAQVFRKSGEEFVALLPGADAAATHAAGERLRQAVEALGIVHQGTSAGIVTTTIGAALAEEATDLAGAGQRAAVAAHKAKVRGERNRAHVPDPRSTGDRSGQEATLLESRVEFCAELTRAGFEDAVWLVYLDLNHLGRINKTLGFLAGDHLVTETGRRLAQQAGNHRAARAGGDAFLVGLGPGSEEEAVASARSLLAALGRPIPLPDVGNSQTASVTASAGLTRLHPGEDPGEAVERAHQAYILARTGGTSQLHLDPT